MTDWCGMYSNSLVDELVSLEIQQQGIQESMHSATNAAV
jgi:hypothetical protein